MGGRVKKQNGTSVSYRFDADTIAKIRGLSLDLDVTQTEAVEMAIHQLWQREVGAPDRDLAVEIDALAARVAALERLQDR